jgi:hypothetical protein
VAYQTWPPQPTSVAQQASPVSAQPKHTPSADISRGGGAIVFLRSWKQLAVELSSTACARIRATAWSSSISTPSPPLRTLAPKFPLSLFNSPKRKPSCPGHPQSPAVETSPGQAEVTVVTTMLFLPSPHKESSRNLSQLPHRAHSSRWPEMSIPANPTVPDLAVTRIVSRVSHWCSSTPYLLRFRPKSFPHR